MTCSTSPMSSGSSALVGSSKRSTLGSMHRARAMATRCFWPPDSRAGYSSRFSARPTLARYASACVTASAFETPSTRVGASMRFWSTLMCGKRLNSWNTMPARIRIWRICSRWALLRAWSGSDTTRTPSISMVPADGSSRKFTQRRNVVFPLPERPMSMTASPCADHHVHPSEDVVAAVILLDPLCADDGIAQVRSHDLVVEMPVARCRRRRFGHRSPRAIRSSRRCWK